MRVDVMVQVSMLAFIAYVIRVQRAKDYGYEVEIFLCSSVSISEATFSSS